MRRLAAVVLMLLGGCAEPANEPDPLAGFEWLTGTWDRVDVRPGETATERWFRDGQSMLGVGVTMVNGDTVFVERITLGMRDGGMAYTPKTPGNDAPVPFALEESGSEWFVVFNPDHDFPKRIEYRLEGDTLRAAISGDGRGGSFLFVRRQE